MAHSLAEYVEHEDIFIPTQTMEDALLYHTNLRLGPSISQEAKSKRIQELTAVLFHRRHQALQPRWMK